MIPTQNKIDGKALQFFRKKKVMRIDQLALLLERSIPTARRRLKEWKTYTSYNHNGKYYVLPDVAKFDTNGLWQYGSIRFSKYGTLKETVIHLVKNSDRGLFAQEIGHLVGLAPHSFLSHFRDASGLQRERLKGRWIYFSSEEEIGSVQKRKRERWTKNQSTSFPPDAEAVQLLVERIQHPHLSLDDLSKTLRTRGISISAESIRCFLEHHGLLKKTADTLSFDS